MQTADEDMFFFIGCEDWEFAEAVSPEKADIVTFELLIHVFFTVYNNNALVVFAYALACKIVHYIVYFCVVFNSIDTCCYVIDFNKVTFTKLNKVLFSVE